MSASDLMLPVFVQVLLTFVVLIALGRARGQSLQARQTSRANNDVAMGSFSWSDAAIKASNNFSNQFEIPVLFYAAVAFALILKQSDLTLVVLAWIFAVSRIVHAIIHTGANKVSWRFPVYLIGTASVLTFWCVLMVRVLGGAVAV